MSQFLQAYSLLKACRLMPLKAQVGSVNVARDWGSFGKIQGNVELSDGPAMAPVKPQ